MYFKLQAFSGLVFRQDDERMIKHSVTNLVKFDCNGLLSFGLKHTKITLESMFIKLGINGNFIHIGVGRRQAAQTSSFFGTASVLLYID